MRTFQFGPLPCLSPDFEGAGGGAAETNPATDGASGAPEGEEVSARPEGDDQSFDDGEGGDAQPEDEDEEIEHEGKKFKLPKALKPLLMFQQDYTRKTQEVAETRRTLETERTSLVQQVEAEKANIQDVARLVNIDGQLEQFKAVNWQELERDDPLQAQSLWRQFQQLKDTRQEVAGQLSQKMQQRSLAAQQETAKRVQEAHATLSRDIKGWGPELAAKVTEFGRNVGFSDEELSATTDPRVVKTLHLAMLGQQLMNKQMAGARPAAGQQPAAKPAPTVGGAARAAKDPGRMSMSEYAKWRAAGNG